MAHRHVRYTTAALAAGLTVGAALLAMPDALGSAAGGTSPVEASGASFQLPTAHLQMTSSSAFPSTAVPSTAAASTPTTEPAPAAGSPVAAPPVGDVSGLTASGIPETALDAYRQAAAGAPCSIDWSLLAAIGRVESNHGRFGGASLHTDGLSAPVILGPALNGVGFALILDTDGGAVDGDASLDRAVGPMQFIPSTWKLYARDGNGDGRADPFNIYDATAGAADYLCAAGGDLSTVTGQARAVFAYNHSDTYVATVLNLAAAYAGTTPPVIPPTSAEQAPVPPVNPGPPPAVAPETAAAASPTEAAPSTPAVTPTPTTTTPAETTTPPTTTPPTTTPPTTTPPTTTPPTTTPPTTTPPTTTPPTTTPPTTTRPTTTPPTTTPPTTTPPTTTPPTTTPPTTRAPATTTATTTAPATTTTSATATSATTTTTPPASTTPSCPALTVDVLNTTGDPANATQAKSYLQAPGVVVGTVRTTGTAATSAIQYPAGQKARATEFAQAVGVPGLLAQGDVPHVTVVLGPNGVQDLLAKLHAFPGLTCG